MVLQTDKSWPDYLALNQIGLIKQYRGPCYLVAHCFTVHERMQQQYENTQKRPAYFDNSAFSLISSSICDNFEMQNLSKFF